MPRLARDDIRKVISDAYYGSRNGGRTMEDAADVAADGVVGLLLGQAVKARFDPATCEHEIVRRVDNGPGAPVPIGWYCERCNLEFVPADE
jgi:hypothetical protein